MTVRRARPAETEVDLQTQITDLATTSLAWLQENWWWVVALILGIILAVFLLRKLRSKYQEIEKLWVFTLFFLTKRQMMIPLVIHLSTKDKLLDKATQKKLMDIRERCRDVSFKKSPQARLALEVEVSHILFEYFSKLEKNNQLKSGSRLYKIVEDLEFIDAKLVQLQQVYNAETTKWNRKIGVFRALLKPFGIKTFESFS